MTFLTEMGLLWNTVGLMVSGGLFVFALLFLNWCVNPPEGLLVNDQTTFFMGIPLVLIFGVPFLFFATRFVKLVWAL